MTSRSRTAAWVVAGSLLLALLVTATSCREEALEVSTDRVQPGTSAPGPKVDADQMPTGPGTSSAAESEPAETLVDSGNREPGDTPQAADKAATPKSKDAKKGTPAGALDEYPLQTNPLAGCTLCHVDVEDKFVGTIHFEEEVGCQTCHGPSEGHVADENNEVKPDEVFARKDVDRLCGECHECPRPVPAKPELTAQGQRKVCIDCHGPHDVALAEQYVSSNP